MMEVVYKISLTSITFLHIKFYRNEIKDKIGEFENDNIFIIVFMFELPFISEKKEKYETK